MSDSHHSTSNTQEMWTAAVCWEGAFTTQTCWGPTPSSQPVILGRLLLWPGHTHTEGHMQESRQMLTYWTCKKGMYRLKAQILYMSLAWCSVVRLLFTTYKYDVDMKSTMWGCCSCLNSIKKSTSFPPSPIWKLAVLILTLTASHFPANYTTEITVQKDIIITANNRDANTL